MAWIPALLKENKHNRVVSELSVLLLGIGSLFLGSKINLPQPGFNIPFTLLGFFASMIGLLYGSFRSFLVLASFVLLIVLFRMHTLPDRIPDFSFYCSIGYPLGVALSALCLSFLIEKSEVKKSFKQIFACLIACALLSYLVTVVFLMRETDGVRLIIYGVAPYLFGDFLKAICAAWLVFLAYNFTLVRKE